MSIALTSRLARKKVLDDLGVGRVGDEQTDHSAGDTDAVSKQDLGLAHENDGLRRENLILKEEREILKKATVFFARQKP